MAINKASQVSTVTDSGIGDGGLKKLIITALGKDDKELSKVTALFNPHEIRRSRTVNWQQRAAANQGSLGVGGQGGWWAGKQRAAAGMPRRDPATPGAQQEYLSAAPRTMTIELFFDTYEAREPASTWAQVASFVTPPNPFQRRDATDVTLLTRQVAALAEPDRELHCPPVCRLSWGKFADVFTGVLTRVDERFTLFLPDGMPVRATLTCSFVESLTPAQVKAREQNSSDVVKTWVVRRGDTLHSVAAAEFGDPRLWRHIAEANGIDDPRALPAGAVLTIPKLS
jgi:nucleoid-associated protein YgaU